MSNKDALNQCLEWLRSGRSLEECLAAYPDKAVELEPLLRAALALGQAPQPSPQFRAALGQRLEAAWQARQRRPRSSFSLMGRRWALAGALALALVLGGASTALASSSSVPGDVLYPAKRATERVRLVLTISKSRKANLELQFAGKRVQEMAVLVKREAPPEEVEKLVQRLEAHLDKVERIAGELEGAPPSEGTPVLERTPKPQETPVPEGTPKLEKTPVSHEVKAQLRQRLEENAGQGLVRLRQELDRLPEAKKAKARAILKKVDERYEEAWRSMEEQDGGAPAVTPTPPPWRQKETPSDVPRLPLRPQFKNGAALPISATDIL